MQRFRGRQRPYGGRFRPGSRLQGVLRAGNRGPMLRKQKVYGSMDKDAQEQGVDESGHPKHQPTNDVDGHGLQQQGNNMVAGQQGEGKADSDLHGPGHGSNNPQPSSGSKSTGKL